MSQIWFSSRKTTMGRYTGPVKVMTGWDRPLQHFFLRIVTRVKQEAPTGGPGVIYNSLDDANLPMGGISTAQRVCAIIIEQGVSIPANLQAALEYHQRENKGNLIINLDTNQVVYEEKGVTNG